MIHRHIPPHPSSPHLAARANVGAGSDEDADDVDVAMHGGAEDCHVEVFLQGMRPEGLSQ